MPTKLFTSVVEDQIIEWYRSGMPQTEIAKRLNCQATTISRLLMKRGEARGKGYGRAPAMVWRHGARVKDLYSTGLSTEEIAREVGICAEAVKKILVALDVRFERRPRSGDRHASWNGGRYINDRGYVEVIDDDPAYASMRGSDGYTPEHRLVIAKALGRPLKRHETVHHIDGNRQNNAFANLELRQGKHGTGVRMRCRACGSHDVEAVELAAGET